MNISRVAEVSLWSLFMVDSASCVRSFLMGEYQPDILATNLTAIFCGINPSASSEMSGHNFSAPSNRFWSVLHLSGFTDVRLHAQDECRLLEYGYGITTVVRRSTRRASEVSPREFLEARLQFEDTMHHLTPRVIAFLGKRGFAAMMRVAEVDWGCQPLAIAGIPTWILPNPSGLNRRFTLDGLVRAYSQFRLALDEFPTAPHSLIRDSPRPSSP